MFNTIKMLLNKIDKDWINRNINSKKVNIKYKVK